MASLRKLRRRLLRWQRYAITTGCTPGNGCRCDMRPRPFHVLGAPGCYASRDAEQNREMRQSMNADGEL